ncbi:hypothetical protein ACQKWADRAFT_305514 [Trichoderma austrokoningii]
MQLRYHPFGFVVTFLDTILILLTQVVVGLVICCACKPCFESAVTLFCILFCLLVFLALLSDFFFFFNFSSPVPRAG